MSCTVSNSFNEITDQIVGLNTTLKKAYKNVQNLAPHNTNILITGETGTGKGVIAQLIHSLSTRRDEPFIQINCANISESLFESELFGHVKGAFTGASNDKTGLIEQANGGTLFLDEIGEMPLNLQTKLLLVLENKQIRKVGDNKDIKIDFRLVSASNIDFKEAITEKRFRQDLYYRINYDRIILPPLRERLEDFDKLVKYLLTADAVKMNIKPIPIDVRALFFLKRYSWPGNIRQLQQILHKALMRCKEQPVITASDFHELIVEEEGSPDQNVIRMINDTAGYSGLSDTTDNNIFQAAIQYISANILSNGLTFREIENEIILAILHCYNNNVLKAAKAINLHPRKLYRILEKHNLLNANKEEYKAADENTFLRLVK